MYNQAVHEAPAKFNKNIVTGVVALADAPTIAADAAAGNNFTLTLGGSRTMAAPLNPVDGQTITFRITQDSEGSRTITWNSSAFRFADDAPITLTQTAGKTDYLVFKYNETAEKWDCVGAALNL